jgi:hypothetical protein
MPASVCLARRRTLLHCPSLNPPPHPYRHLCHPKGNHRSHRLRNHNPPIDMHRRATRRVQDFLHTHHPYNTRLLHLPQQLLPDRRHSISLHLPHRDTTTVSIIKDMGVESVELLDGLGGWKP